MGLIIAENIKTWPNIFLNYFGIIHSKYINFKFRRNGGIKIKNIENKEDTSGIAMVWEVFIKKNYCPKGMEIKNNDLVIDIGSNIGIFSIYASMKSPKGKIYSYEPFKTHYNRFLKNIELNNLKNINPNNLAVCRQKGKRELFINEKSSGMHSVIFKENSKNKAIINCTTLKDIFEINKIKKCNFLKIDCEGAEYEIIYNTPKNILCKIEKISLEFDNIDKKDKNCFSLKKFLEANNFKVTIKGANQHQGILYAKNIGI